jgi:hypothetical protein
VYQFRGRDHQVVVNGHTGRIAGEYPKSPWKIAALIVLGLALAAVLALVASSSG